MKLFKHHTKDLIFNQAHVHKHAPGLLELFSYKHLCVYLPMFVSVCTHVSKNGKKQPGCKNCKSVLNFHTNKLCGFFSAV